MSKKKRKTMSKLSLNTTSDYSLNFDQKKRRANQIKFIVFHYTGMRSEVEAIKKLKNIKSKVSSHYLIKKNGKIINLVPDLYIAWHAGISTWRKKKFLNRYSIGIEITNPGHEFNYRNFSKKQIHSTLKLSRFLVKKYKIKNNSILGHSDIAPDRKKDPGEKFPWKFLAKNKIGYWHNLDEKHVSKKRKKKISSSGKNKFKKNLLSIGYTKNSQKIKKDYLKLITTAFQRRFRPILVNGIIDEECLLISENIVKKFKKIT